MIKIFSRFMIIGALYGAVPLMAANNCCRTTCSSSSTDSNKTFLMPRSPGVNLALEYTDGWRGLLYRPTIDKFGGNIQGIFFDEKTTSHHQIGAYFSPNSNRFNTSIPSSPCQPCNDGHSFTFGFRLGDDQSLTQDLNLRSFIHLPFPTGSSADELAATMSLSMKRSVTGFVLNIHQDLDKIWKGLFFKLNVPIARAEHSVNCCIKGDELVVDDVATISDHEVTKALANYFSGNEVNVEFTDETHTGVLQQRLKYALIPCTAGAGCSEERIGIADIDFQLGYHVISTNDYHASVALGITIPTGNEVNGNRMWEPIVGNGGHTGVGINLYGDAKIWGTNDHNIFIMGALNYKYLLEFCECRKLGLCGQQWGQYLLLGQKNERLLVPAANVLAQKVDVTPGNQIDLIIQANYNFYGFACDLGYNLYYKGEESINFSRVGNVLENNTYAIPSKDFVNSTPSTIFGSGDNSQFEGGIERYLSEKDIDKSVAKTPLQISHKFYGGISFGYKKWEIPILVGIGAHYELSGMNKTPETWGFNVKAAVAF